MPLWRCLCGMYVSALDKIYFMKWPLRNCGARDVTDIVQTVQYNDSQCTLYTVKILAQVSTLQLVACRALLYSTTIFYTVRVLLIIVLTGGKQATSSLRT